LMGKFQQPPPRAALAQRAGVRGFVGDGGNGSVHRQEE